MPSLPQQQGGSSIWGNIWGGIKKVGSAIGNIFSNPGVQGAIGAGANVLGDTLAYKGAQQTNAANAAEAQRNREFQQEMSNTSYQRAVEDMRKAGLNPALAYQQGGASAASGNMATFQNPAANMRGTAAQAAEAFNAVATAVAQRRNIDAQTSKTQAEANQLRIESEERLRDLAGRAKISASTAAQIDKALGIERELNSARAQNTAEDTRGKWYANNFAAQTIHDRIKQVGLGLDDTVSQIRYRNAMALLAELQTPDARNRALSADTWVGKNLRPWINDASGAARAIKGLFPQY